MRQKVFVSLLCSVLCLHRDRRRQGHTQQSRQIGFLFVNPPLPTAPSSVSCASAQSADFITSVPNWHKVRLSSGVEGSPARRSRRSSPVRHLSRTSKSTFYDVATGDSAIIDIGDKEIVIDGGLSTKVLSDYVARTGSSTGRWSWLSSRMPIRFTGPG
jgi:hypothetical protein